MDKIRELDQQIISSDNLEVKKGSSLLLVPPDILIPDDCDIPVYDWSWESIATIFSNMEFPVILKADANHAEMLYRIAHFRDVALKTMYGLIGDYPSFWSISFSAYPRVDFHEYKLAKADSEIAGGDSIPSKKKPTPEMKPLDPTTLDRIGALSETAWRESENEQP